MDKMVKIKELSQLLNISTATLYRLIKRGVIHSTRIGNSVRICPSELHRILQQDRIREEELPTTEKSEEGGDT